MNNPAVRFAPHFIRGRWSWWRAIAAGVLSSLAIGVPTDVIDTPLFTRMTPVRWWELPVLISAAILTAAWAGLRVVGGSGRGGSHVVGSTVLGALAVGCPICNKAVVALLGVSGALGVWAPLQPLLGVASVAVLAAAVYLRWRRRGCTEQDCQPPDPSKAHAPARLAAEPERR